MTLLQSYILGASLYLIFLLWKVWQTDSKTPSPWPQQVAFVIALPVAFLWPVIVPISLYRYVAGRFR